MKSKPIADLTSFRIQNPTSFDVPQQESLKWMALAHIKAEEAKQQKAPLNAELIENLNTLFFRYAMGPSSIKRRSFDLGDLFNSDWNENKIYHFGTLENTLPNGYGIGKRNQFFAQRALEVFRSFYPKNHLTPDHIIHVSCTGYAAPSAAQRLVIENDWGNKTNVTHAYHMGCYGAMPSIRMGEGLIASSLQKNHPSPVVDIVHTEMCSLHMNPADHSPEQIIVQTLFADGHVKYSLVPAGSARSGFTVLNVAEEIIADSTEDMTWAPSDWGMKMSLSRDVPRKIAFHIKPLLEKLIKPTGYSLETVLKEARFAIHPGGPKIVEAAQFVLEITDDQVSQSKEMLFLRGNMSSATLPHIWKSILDQGAQSGELVVSLVFGPGLTLFGSLFRVI